MNVTIKKLKTLFTPFKKAAHRPILAHVKVDEDGLHLTDLETFITIKNKFDLSKGLHPIETVTLLNKPNDIDINEYPLTNFTLGIVAKYKVKMSHLKELLQYVSKDETRLHLNCIAFDQQNLVSCDGHTLMNIKTTYDNESDCTFLVNHSTVNHILKLAKIHKIDELEFEFSEEHLTIETLHFKVTARLCLRDYPKWSTVVPLPEKCKKSFNLGQWINLKEIKALFNKRGTCEVFSEDGIVYLSPRQTIASDQRFEIGTTKDNFNVGFNVNLLDRLLSNCNEGNLIQFAHEMSPFVVFDENITRVIMPLKL